MRFTSLDMLFAAVVHYTKAHFFPIGDMELRDRYRIEKRTEPFFRLHADNGMASVAV